MAKYLKKMTPRKIESQVEVQEVVGKIIESIRAEGDEAVKRYSQKFV